MRQPYRKPAEDRTVPLGLIECPHCLSRVLAESDGTCPSCRQNVLDAPERVTSAKVRVGESTRVPEDVCCTCGAPADVMEAVGAGSDDQLAGWLRVLIVVILALTCLWVLLLVRDSVFFRKAGPPLRLLMPRCNACRRDPLIPEHINLAQRTMTFVVSRDFADRLKAANTQRQLRRDATRG